MIKLTSVVALVALVSSPSFAENPFTFGGVVVGQGAETPPTQTPAPASNAQEIPNPVDVLERYYALRESDRELFELIQILLKKPDVEGGFDLDYQADGFECSDGLYSEGLEQCELTVDIKIESHADRLDQRSAEVQVACSAGVKTDKKDGYPGSVDEYVTETYRLYRGSSSSSYETMTINFSVSDLMLPVVSVRLTYLECEIDGIS